MGIVSSLCRITLKVFKWKVQGSLPDTQKFVFAVAPHTSLFDFVVGKLYMSSQKRNACFLIKENYFWFPLGVILKLLGAIPVLKTSGSNMIHKAAKDIKMKDSFCLIVTPEGTRKLRTKWQRGFYYIAMKAEVPIMVGFLDYSKKIIDLGPMMEPSGDIEADMIKIKKYFIGVKGRHPEKFSTGLEDEKR